MSRSKTSRQLGTERPIELRTGEPIGPMAQPGYYPGYSTLSQKGFWDAKTRAVIMERVNQVPPIRFFSHSELLLIESICEHIIPQSDRNADHRIPIVNFIDQRLFENRIDGYRYEKMPTDQEAYRLALRAIDEIGVRLYSRGFPELDPLDQDKILESLHDGTPESAHEIWKQLPVHRFWMLLVQDCVEVYYAHPWAWDEIGFGGPAYPRGYTRLERGEAEPWEKEERRYEWKAPADSVSDVHEPVEGMNEHEATPGQGGTH